MTGAAPDSAPNRPGGIRIRAYSAGRRPGLPSSPSAGGGAMTTSELHAADVEDLVRVLDDARQDDPGPLMPWALLEGLHDLVPCDLDISYQQHEPAASRTLRDQAVEPGGVRLASDGPDPADPDDPFWQYWWTGFCSWPQRTGDLRAVIHTGDFLTTERQRLADPLSEINPEVR